MLIIEIEGNAERPAERGEAPIPHPEASVPFQFPFHPFLIYEYFVLFSFYTYEPNVYNTWFYVVCFFNSLSV